VQHDLLEGCSGVLLRHIVTLRALSLLAPHLHYREKVKQTAPSHLNLMEIKMKLLCTLRLIEESFSAAAFAEENEHQTARELLRQEEAERPSCCAHAGSDEHRLAHLTAAAV